ncbi:CIA30 family protein [Aspergillus ibericus CBS 121593]|uniref:CIA30-domain-containing protein n=1 Tax=Aspergillus ibericus CBS 121593 TaxID=1448316 RepID=A0A395GP60_9EURO|nr:CIA30-domain-containing protein [Aspergillus ibericus CBS 121593]RAK95813.1 CIA30-domain-containing protein [Aspergillus ibericus CBS 121593]
MSYQPSPYLFGGPHPWSSSNWTSTDDRVRGGASHSTLTINPTTNTALFHGTLDITTLGGAGFASQRTTSTITTWDLSSYTGLELSIPNADNKTYTLNLKDELPERRPGGRERSGVVWEVDFKGPRDGGKVRVGWEDFKATYRGREVRGGRKLDLAGVRRVGIMVRSFFGEQEGAFELEVEWIKGIQVDMGRYRDEPDASEDDEGEWDEKRWSEEDTRGSGSGWLCCGIF